MRAAFVALWALCEGCSIELNLGAIPPDAAYADRPTRATDSAALRAEQVALGEGHLCARVAEAVLCWGDNGRGQLGLSGETAPRAEGDPALVPLPRDVRSIHAGGTATCAVTSSGEAWCWGDGTRAPSRVAGLSARQLCVGRGFYCAVDDAARVLCWGANDRAQLARADREPSRAPRVVEGVQDARAVACGRAHACALRGDGRVLCWGANDDGQSGADARGDVTTPVLLDAIEGATQVRAGAQHGCAVAQGGRVLCWGRNDWGQLGDGSNRQRARAAPVRAELALGPIALGDEHGCALTAERGVLCWGRNTCGELGNGLGESSRALPDPARAVRDLAGASQVACGGSRCCAIADGALLCWGRAEEPEGCAGAAFAARRVDLRGPR